MFGAPFPGLPAVQVSFVDHQDLGPSNATQTFSGLSFGAPSTYRYIAVCLAWVVNNPLTSCTIGGVSASILTQINYAGATATCAAICIALVPIGSTGAVVANFGGAVINASVAIYSVLGIPSPAASSVATNNANSPSVVMNVPQNGAVIAVSLAASVPALSAAWTNLTGNVLSALGTDYRAAASAQFAAAQTGITLACGWSPVPFLPAVGAFAAFGP